MAVGGKQYQSFPSEGCQRGESSYRSHPAPSPASSICDLKASSCCVHFQLTNTDANNHSQYQVSLPPPVVKQRSTVKTTHSYGTTILSELFPVPVGVDDLLYLLGREVVVLDIDCWTTQLLLRNTSRPILKNGSRRMLLIRVRGRYTGKELGGEASGWLAGCQRGTLILSQSFSHEFFSKIPRSVP